MKRRDTDKTTIATLTAAGVLVSMLLFSIAGAVEQEAPPGVIAALTVKLMAFEKTIGGSSRELTIFVLGAPAIAEELKVGLGTSVGSAKLVSVLKGDGLPTAKPSVLFIGNAAKSGEAIQYARANKVLTVTGIPSLVSKGVTLGIALGDSGKPEILLNLTASVAEGLDWNPAIMKVAKTIK